jgi:cation transport protein ChaC
MWVFGYGSLMWDGWYKDFDGDAPAKASLPGFRRRFNKGSVANWGLKQTPGPTLNIEAGEGYSCVGMAFQLPDQRKSEVLGYLQKREGKPFKLEEHSIVVDGGSEVTAIVPVYHGKNIVAQPLDELVELALHAKGTSGACVNYVINIDRELVNHDIHDDEVKAFAARLRERM